ncbi:serine/threonine-protein kinase [Streptomyces sp. NPDC102381]|uniref:serine/threonine-protein kinase n=1 Tax=Streptomyces sp. NPDC102381 TaxID=3366164 RepID=UPI003829A0D0
MAGMPERIGRYTVTEELGSGGMGEVYLAHSPLGEPVAVKVIRSDRLDPITRARFEKEALIARTVIGTNRVARFLDADPFADRPWLAMEYVAGRTLLACIDEDGALPAPLVASLGGLLAEGLQAVHQVNLVHRDLKPQNVIMGSEGPMIIDFGLGAIMDAAQDSLSHSGQIIGTVRCMPPEQARGNPHVTHAADVYALGTVLLYAATRHYPYDGQRWDFVAAQVTNPEVGPDLGGVPEALKPLLTAMLAHEADERPALEAVARMCAQLLADTKTMPSDARLSLIHRTRGGKPSAASPQQTLVVDPLLYDQISLDDAVLPSPLDVPAVVEQEPAQPKEPPISPAAPEHPEHRGKPRSAPGRPPASKKVADELRTQYAVSAEL